MIAAGIFIDTGCAAELTPDDDGNILVHAPLVQVGDQSGQGAVEQWQVFAELEKVAALASS